MYITPLLGTDGASAGNSVTTGVADGLELWISVCNTLGSACNNPQNGMRFLIRNHLINNLL